ncbi:MAG: MBL fold metallo-hydrolase [Lachnospiraceae bacterium]|nr:MBL fold metallo-hydrolase [Lachnospiraceae bacterium]
MRKVYQNIIKLILAVSIIASGFLLNLSVTLSAADTDKMEVHFIDVGQGDATLITNGGHSMLIDAGDDTKGTTIQNYLQKQNIKKLDYLILTHPDADHIGGAPVIITKFDIDKVFMSNYEKDNKTYQKLIQAMDNKRLKGKTPAVGSQYALGTAQITILAPNKTYNNPNDASIALIIQNGDNKFLFTGDAQEPAENDILENDLAVSADVYHAGHHGSRTSTSETFFAAVKPSYAVISCGVGNSYGHPHAQTLNTFRTNGVKVYRTDEQGSIIAVSDGKEITWNCTPSETWLAGEATVSSSTVGEVADSSVVTYVCNKNTKKFHKPACSSVNDMSEKNKLEVTLSREEVIAQGYVPCKRCKP